MRTVFSVAAIAALAMSTGSFGEPPLPPYKQASVPIERRVSDLLSRMSLEEKVAQLTSDGFRVAFFKEGQLDEKTARDVLGQGLGTMPLRSDGGIARSANIANYNTLQSWVMKNTRLGIPILLHGEGLHGAVIPGATSFPQAIGLGSTWNPELLRQMFDVVGQEARAAGMTVVLAPVLDLARDPRFGRVEEMYSEDPYLVAQLGVAAVEGLQNKGQVIATAKHFIHGQPESGTNTGPDDSSVRTLRSVYLPPFEQVVKVARVGAIMPSYNEIDGGVPSSVNSWLLKDVLRKEWGFEGLTLSDYYAIRMLKDQHQLAPTAAAAGIMAFNAGVDVELPNPNTYASLVDAVKGGAVSEADINAAVERVLKAKFAVGLFERPYIDLGKFEKAIANRQHAALARKVADQSIVLLKNEGNLLPLDPSKLRSLAVIGPNADKMRLGTYSSMPASYVTVLEGVRRRLGNKARITYAEGVRISEPDSSPIANRMALYQAPSAEADARLIHEALEVARNADVVLLVLGGNETVSREAFGPPTKAYGDTDTLDLPGRQDELVAEIAKLGKPTAAVLLNGRPYASETLDKSVPAILEGWYLGQETGNAVAGVLFGDVNPSGRLPVTIPRSVGQLPAYYYHSPVARLGYVSSSNVPLYPFGHGLSYTRFTYGKPSLDRTEVPVGGTARVKVTVTNAGARAGDEVVQVYLRQKFGSVVRPVARLAAFRRVHLGAGQAVDVNFDIGPEQLAAWGLDMQRKVEPGVAEIMIGPNALQTEAVELRIR